jgi:Uma2 family endonuclease
MIILPIPTDTWSVIGPTQGQWTYADWETLPDDDNRYEVIDGVLYVSTAPSFFHQWIISRLYRHLGVPAEDKGLAFTITSPVGVIMPGCDPVQPDFVLVLAEHALIIHNKRIRGVPDLIVEVISPGSIAYDEDVKLTAYVRAGVPEYAIIDPAQRQLRLYQLEKPGHYLNPQIFGEADTVKFACLPTIPVSIAGLFAGSPDTTL